MFVPRKPWPFGNKFHTMCCGISRVLFALELVKGKDQPKELGKPEYEDQGGATVGLILRLTKTIWGTGRTLVLDSGFVC